MTYATLMNGIMVELFTLPDNAAIPDCFVAEIATQFIEITRRQGAVAGLDL